MAQRSLDLIEAMYAAAEAAQPITGRGIGYKLFTAGLIPAPDLQELVERHGGYDKIPPEGLGQTRPRGGGVAGAPTAEDGGRPRGRHSVAEGSGMRVMRKSRRHKRQSAIAQRRLPLGPPTRPRDVESLDTYDAADDFGKSYDDCLRAVRQRIAAGGKGWPR